MSPMQTVDKDQDQGSVAVKERIEKQYRGTSATYLCVKRCLDILIALIVGIIALVPMIIIGVLVRLDSPGPAIFKQERMGQNGKIFYMYKFRSMSTNAPSAMATRDFTDSKSYITKFGAILRRTSLDELPQLLNILKGDMSLIGYRPVCITETELNDKRMDCGVFRAKPGITGLAQVCGRDDIGIDEKVELDAKYVENCSLRMDIWCLFKTVEVVITGEGNR